MKNKSNKPTYLAAFTLIEIMVVLVISGTVISLALWSYLNISRYLDTYQKNEAVNQEMALFLFHFQYDIDQAVYLTEKNGSLTCVDFNEDYISYDFFEDYTIRYYYNYPDTFFVQIPKITWEAIPGNVSLIQRIELTLQTTGIEYPMIFYKNYSNQQLFQAYGD
jgi:prepilin-type N-terminal cleavage/methylation domain-containing protein